MKKQNTNAGPTGRQQSRLLPGHIPRWLFAVVAAGVMSFAAPASADLKIDIRGHVYESKRSGYTEIEISVSNYKSVKSHREYRPYLYLSWGWPLPPRRGYVDTRSDLEKLNAAKEYRNRWKGVEVWQGDQGWQPHARASSNLPLVEGKLFMTRDDWYDYYTKHEPELKSTIGYNTPIGHYYPDGFHSSPADPGDQLVYHRFGDKKIRDNNEYGYFKLGFDGQLKLGLPWQYADESGVFNPVNLKYTFADRLPADFGFIEGSSQTFDDPVFGKVTINVIKQLPLSPGSTLTKGLKYSSTDGRHYLLHASFDNNLMLVRTADDGVVWGLDQQIGAGHLQAAVVRYNNTGTLEVLDGDGKVIYQKKIGNPGSSLGLDATGNFTAQ